MKQMHSLEVKELTYARDERVLFQQLEFAISNGQLLQIVGPNGSGKTTLLRLLTGILSIQQGEILWQRQALQKVRHSFLSSILYIGHHLGIKGELTVFENLSLNLYREKIHQDRFDQALSQMNLLPYRNQFCRYLSQGQKQRVALLKLFLSEHAVWILDEPFTALDQAGMQEIQHLLQKKLQEGGSIILTSHRPLTLQSLPIRYLELGM